MNTLQRVLCVVTLFAGCQSPPEAERTDNHKSPCVTKMEAGKPCGSPETDVPTDQACKDQAGMIVPCPELLMSGPIAGGEDCVQEWTSCKKWCDAVFCSWINPACTGCYFQCNREFQQCIVNF